MYKGNMYEFVEKVSRYTEEHYEQKFSLSQNTFDEEDELEHCSILWCWVDELTAIGEEVKDTVNFEEDVYRIVNEYLETKYLENGDYRKGGRRRTPGGRK